MHHGYLGLLPEIRGAVRCREALSGREVTIITLGITMVLKKIMGSTFHVWCSVESESVYWRDDDDETLKMCQVTLIR